MSISIKFRRSVNKTPLRAARAEAEITKGKKKVYGRMEKTDNSEDERIKGILQEVFGQCRTNDDCLKKYSGRVKGARGKREGHWSFLFPRRGLINEK